MDSAWSGRVGLGRRSIIHICTTASFENRTRRGSSGEKARNPAESLARAIAPVANEGHPRAIGVAGIQHLRDFDRPVGLGPSLAGGRLPEARQRLGEHEDAGRAVPLVLVIDAPACSFVAAIGTRVSLSNCTGCSSMHNTGDLGS